MDIFSQIKPFLDYGTTGVAVLILAGTLIRDHFRSARYDALMDRMITASEQIAVANTKVAERLTHLEEVVEPRSRSGVHEATPPNPPA